MMKQIIVIFFLVKIIVFDCFGQASRYIPVSINSPFFNQTDEILVAAKINNYGLNYSFAGQLKNKILILSLQHNTGQIRFDPLNFNDYALNTQQGRKISIIEPRPSKMLYYELGFGYNFKHKLQKFSLITGVGKEFERTNTRLFVQLDWGNESKLINAGLSLRGNYVIGAFKNLIIIEAMLQGKINIGDFKIINQFGYSIAAKKKEDYIAPVFTVGLEYPF